MRDEDPLRQRYLRLLLWGAVVLALLAIPAVVHSKAAIDSLFNRPADWVSDSLPEKVELARFLRLFTVSDLLMVAWDGSKLQSEQLERATVSLRPLAKTATAEETRPLESFPSSVAEEIRQIQQACGTATPLNWVRSGTEMMEQMTSPPSRLSQRSAISRLQGTLVGEDGEHTAIIVSVAEQGMVHRRALIAGIRRIVASQTGVPVEAIAIVGGNAEGAAVDAESIRSIEAFSPPSAIIAALLCLVFLRSLPMTAAIVAVAVIGQGLVLAAVYYTGIPMNAVLIVLPPLVFVLTVSAGIHLSNYYLDAAADFPELSRAEAAQRAMRAGVIPCCLATGTTVVGLSSLLLVRLHPVRVFGGVASAGVILTLGLLFLVLPGAMVLTRRRDEHPHDKLASSGPAAVLQRWMRKRLVRPWPMIVTFLILGAVFSIGLTRLESNVSVPRMFRADSPLRQHFAWFEEHVGPTVSGEILLTFPKLTEEDDPLERLALVARVHAAALRQPLIEGAMSAVTFVPSVSRGHSLAATTRRSVVRKLIRDPESSLGQLGFIARQGQTEVWRISWRVPLQDRPQFGSDLDALAADVRAVTESSPLEVEPSVTGAVVLVQRTQEILLDDLFRSFMTAFAVIAVVMMGMLRSVTGGLIAMAPNLFPTVALFGALGWLRVPLDIGSVMSASVALGIAVDDTVHLLSRFGSRRARGIGQIRAAFGALRQCFWAMFQTTMVCGISLMAYWFSDFVPTSRFALFMFGMLLSALLGVTLLLPTLMASPLGRRLSRTIGADPQASLYTDGPVVKSPPDTRRPSRSGTRQEFR